MKKMNIYDYYSNRQLRNEINKVKAKIDIAKNDDNNEWKNIRINELKIELKYFKKLLNEREIKNESKLLGKTSENSNH